MTFYEFCQLHWGKDPSLRTERQQEFCQVAELAWQTAQAESATEQQSHDSEIRRIAAALEFAPGGVTMEQIIERATALCEEICTGCYNDHAHCDCPHEIGEPARSLPSTDQSPAETGDGLSLPGNSAPLTKVFNGREDVHTFANWMSEAMESKHIERESRHEPHYMDQNYSLELAVKCMQDKTEQLDYYATSRPDCIERAVKTAVHLANFCMIIALKLKAAEQK